MYLLAAAFFIAALYSLFEGDVSNARYAMAVGVVLTGARFYLGPMEEESFLSRIGWGVKILIVIVAAVYAVDKVFG